MNLLSIFRSIGRLIAKALAFAEARGLTDDLVASALKLVGQAEVQYADGASKRAFVVSQLVARGVPESIARLAVEMAVSLFKGTVVSTRVDPPTIGGAA